MMITRRIGTGLFAVVLLAAGPAAARAEVAPEAAEASMLDFREVIRDAKAGVFPAVVYIKCLVETHESGRKQTHEQGGSGVIISPEGEVLTNWHVVDKATEIRCLLSDGRHFDAEVVCSDKDLDLALVRLAVPESTGVPYAELGESSALTEGDFVMAMGAPWGLSRSVSLGIISCTDRYLEGSSEYSLWLQTDAAISPGNSGGPLVNTDGRVIGINTLGMMQGGDTGFATPSDVIKQVLPRMREKGDISWSWTGLKLQPIRDFDRDVYFAGDKGVIVASTDKGSPARRAGILDGDRILTLGGEPTDGLTEERLPAIRRRLALLTIDEPITLKILRDHETLEVELTPTVKGEVEGEELDAPRFDFTVKAINQFDNPQLHYYRQKGVFIFGIEYPGNASDAGLRQEDIITKIGKEKIETLEDFKRVHAALLEDVEDNPRARVTVLRNGMMRQVVLDFSRDYERE